MRQKILHSLGLLLVAIVGITGCKRSNTFPSMEVEVHKIGEDLAEGDLEIKLEIKEDMSSFFARVVFTNTTNKDVQVLKRNLLYEGHITFAAFKVTRGGKEIPYTGLSVKRGPPSEKDWYLLKAGESYETTIRISDDYDFSP